MSDQSKLSLNRRRFIQGTGTTLLATMAAPAAAINLSGDPAPSTSPIGVENAKEGSRDWQLTRVHVEDGIRSPRIEGYCSHQSVQVGDRLQIMVSTRPAEKFRLEIFRTGYYGGRGARLMTTLGPFEGIQQADPSVGPRRLRECRWKPSVEIEIPEDWLSGVYLGRLTSLPKSSKEAYWQSYVIFVVRDNREADILFQCSDNTWQAYNRWPDRYSLYDDGSSGGWAAPIDVDISFDRPYGKYRQIYDNPQSVGSGEYLCFEFPLAHWLEQQGYDVTYCSNSDMIATERARRCKTFVSLGHDEYWDLRQYDGVKSLIREGMNALFLCGNSVASVTPFVPSTDGRPNRILYRAGRYGGPPREYSDGAHKGRPLMSGPDEALLMGNRNVSPVNGGGDWIVSKPDHWMFEGTGMEKGDSIPGLVGWEFHGEPADLPGLEVVAEGTAWHSGVTPQQWAATIYPGPKGNFVFSAATIFWPQAMSSPPGHMLPWSHDNRPHGPDERVQRVTENLLRKALG